MATREDLLAAARDDAAARAAALARDLADIVASARDTSTDDEHDPEGATIAFERAQVSALLDQARDDLADLDDALARLRDGRYGTCERCGGEIAAERLDARPAARTCIRCATAGS